MRRFSIAVFTLGLACVFAVANIAAGADSDAKSGSGESAIELGLPFQDHAILQRGKQAPVWGWSKPGTKVTVEFAGQAKSATADRHGQWMLELEPLTANAQPAEMVIRTNGGDAVTLKDILVGEVWHASGQSNMEWLAGKSMCAGLARELASAEKEVPIRELRTDTVSALYPQTRSTSEQGWKTIKSASGFSALSLAFANELYQELKVPVGILLTSHSNTRIEAFTERKAIEAQPELKSDAEKIHAGDVTTAEGQAAFDQFHRDLAAWQDEAAQLGFPLDRPLNRPGLPGIAGSWRGPTQFFNGKIAPVIPYAIRGSIWCQGTSNSGDSRLYAARMEALVNGWRSAWGMPEMPFYFTQMQCYGDPDPNKVGFADIRQAQHLFFTNNRQQVGMVVQTDLNPANPGNIHYQNKLHPGMRLARWALAHEYGREIAFTGPIYSGYKVEGDKVVVSFEPESLFGGLMVGSKGQERDHRTGEYVEPAQPTPGQKLTHFRLCGADKQWHVADAVIAGDTVVVRSRQVAEPIGVQYAYSASPLNSNLYNQAGLPATPFAAINGKLIFEYETEAEQIAALEAKYARYIDPDYPIFQVVEYLRDGAVIQRNQPIQVWGHANQGVEVEVTLGDVTQSAIADKRQRWSVTFPARKASAEPITLTAQSNHGHSRIVNNILVGDVWFLTGGRQFRSEWAYNPRDQAANQPPAMPLVREFKMNTNGSWSATPRKRQFETGGGKYRSHWLTADWSKEGHGVTMFAYQFAKALNRPDVPQGFITMSSGRGGRHAFMASPLSWTSFAGVAEVTHPPFQKRLEALRLQDPASAIARKTTAKYVDAVKACQRTIVEASKQGADMAAAPLRFPAFPDASEVIDVEPDMIPTYAHNWCVSPFVPMGVSGVIWVPDASNIGHAPDDYAAELEVYARSLPGTYGQDQVQFLYAQPANSLVDGITAPSIPNSQQVKIEAWPKSLKELAAQLGRLAK